MAIEVAVLVNPTAGGGKGARLAEPVTSRLTDAGIVARWEAGRNAEEATDLARRAVARGVAGIVVVGGDGMVHLVVQALAGTSTALGVIPAGSGNDLARALGIPRRDPLAATDLVIAGHRRSVDLGRVGGVGGSGDDTVEDRWFSTVLCSGIDSRIAGRVQRMRSIRGRLRYDLATVAELRDFRPRSYELDLDGRRIATDALLVAVGNTDSYGGGLAMCAGADPTDGAFQVAVIGGLRRRDLISLYPKLSSGGHRDHPLVEMHQAASVRISLDTASAAEGAMAFADGEPISALPVTAETVPGALTVFAPPAG